MEDCNFCGSSYDDCSEDSVTCANCETHMCEDCGTRQADMYGCEIGTIWGDSALKECVNCTDKIIRAADVLEYLIKKTGLVYDDIVVELKKERGIK